ncbi:Protein kintoun [Nymphon striatum]|nr:Protein kintoun [Nymphon striatum]
MADDLPVEVQRMLLVEDTEKLLNYKDENSTANTKKGANVVFLYPKPGHVLECIDDDHPSEKVFVNICSNEHVGDVILVPMPLDKHGQTTDSLRCSVPSLLCQPKYITEEDEKKCQVFDVMFHPNAFDRAETVEYFKKMMNLVAVKAIKSKFLIKLSDTNIKNTNLKYKGTPGEFILRTKVENNVNSPTIDGDCDITEVIAAISDCEIEQKPKFDSQIIEPKYIMRHRSEMSLQDFTINSRDSAISTKPNELIVDIELPLIKNMVDIKLDVLDKKLNLESKNVYFLEINLPYYVNEALGKAEFHKDTQKLTVTLPVVQSAKSEYSSSEDTFRTNKCETNKLTNAPVKEICSNKLQHIADFVSDSDLFQFPFYNHFQTQNEVLFKLHVPNVEFDSLKKFCDGNECAVLFESNGSSTIPIKYSFYLKFPNNCCISSLELEISSSKVILKLIKNVKSQFTWEKFEAGLHSSKLLQYSFLTESSIRERLHKIETEYGSKKHDQYEVKVQHMDENEIPESIEEVEEEPMVSMNNNLRHSHSNPISIKTGKTIPRKVRSMSESATDDIVNKRRGILKMRKTHVRRTMSESSDEISPSSPDSLNEYWLSHSSPDIVEEEEYSTEDLDRPKKTVRFLDKVSENIFRSNCSILAQRKKNQKGIKHKKKSALRRNPSDSGNSSCSEPESTSEKLDYCPVRSRSNSYPYSKFNSRDASKILIENVNITDDNNNSDGSLRSDNDDKVIGKKKSRRGKKKNKCKKVTGGE